MRIRTILLCSLILQLVSLPLAAQQTGDPEKTDQLPSLLGSNAEGTHFIVGFMQNEENTSFCSFLGDRPYPRHRIAVASRFQTIVTLTYPDGRQIQRMVQPFQVSSFFLDGEDYECLGEDVCHKSFEISSQEPISVYCFSSKTHTSDGYLALPTDSWGTDYFAAAYYLDHYRQETETADPFQCAVEPRGGEFAVIAGEDFTTVTVVPKTGTKGGHPANIPFQQVLMKGEIWQIQDGGDTRGGSDITGSHITADKPVGVLSGHVRTAIPWSLDTKDHLIEMIPPKTALGTQHTIIPFGGRRGGDIVRVIASEEGPTDITVTTNIGRLLYRINGAGSFQELPVSTVTVIDTDKPVLVAHYSQSNEIDLQSSFDPYMIVTTPTEQFVNSAIFQTMPDYDAGNRRQFTQHFVTLVVEKRNYTTMRLNNQPLVTLPSIIATGTVPGPTEEYVWLTIRLNGGQSFVIEGSALFGGYVYGIGQFDSYGWPVGAGLFDTDIPDETAPKIAAAPLCNGQWYDIVVTDSGTTNRGLSDVWLDRSASFNVDTATDAMCVCGTNIYTMQVRLVDPGQPGMARIIARDVAEHLDTIEVELQAVQPLFSRDSVLILSAEEGRLRQENFVITNPSAGKNIRFDSIRLQSGAEFKVVGFGSGSVVNQYIAAGQNFDLLITFRADENRAYYDTLLLYIDCHVYKIPLMATMAVPVIGTRDTDFGAVRVGRLKCLEVPVTNTGDGTLRIHKVRLNGTRATFIYDKDGVPVDTIELEPGDTAYVLICFEPDALEDFTGTVEFFSNAAAGDSVADLTGRGIYPAITIGGYDFGSVQVGDTACTRVPIANNGSDTALLTGVTIAENVFVEDPSVFPHALPPGDTLWVSVCFIPGKEGDFSSLIGADNSDGLEATAALVGNSYELLAEIDGYDWGTRWVGTEHDTIVHIHNRTGRPIRVDSIWIANGDEGDFAILTQIPPSITLEPNGAYPINVRFTPLVRGARSVGIYAATSSRLRPVIENVLEGFGIQALPGDDIRHDTALMFSCDSRISRVLIYNRGNSPLTLSSIRLDDPNGIATLNAPNPGYQIPIGDDPLELEVNFDLAGYLGEGSATVTWSFAELPGEEYTRTMKIRSEPQRYTIAATAPPRVDVGEEFNLLVAVQDAFWKNIPTDEVTLEIAYNPTVTYFDSKRWKTGPANAQGGWMFTAGPVYADSNLIRFTLRPVAGGPIPLEGEVLPALPFRGFLGNMELDTFRIALQAGDSLCILPSVANLPYSLEQICGLQNRLLEIGGTPPALRASLPNPASASVEIGFTIPFDGTATLELFSLDGKRIRRIIDGSMTSGDHSVTLDVRDLPNGVYYYRLEYGSFSASQPLLIRR